MTFEAKRYAGAKEECLNNDLEAADRRFALRLQREDRFGRVAAQAQAESDEKVAGMAQREEFALQEDVVKQEAQDEALAVRLEQEERDEEFASDVAAEEERADASVERSERRDALLAKQVESELAGELDQERSVAEAKDCECAKQTQRRMRRAAFCVRKRADAVADAAAAVSVADRWAAAASSLELEDVGEAVAVSLRLPNLCNVKVAAEGRFVKVEARRARLALAPRTADDDGPASLALKLEIVKSTGTCFVDNDLDYDYDCESGYLHVFLEGLKLGRLDRKERTSFVRSLREQLAESVSTKIRKVFGPKTGSRDENFLNLGAKP